MSALASGFTIPLSPSLSASLAPSCFFFGDPYRMSGVNSAWKTLCIPAKIFPIGMASVILFNFYIGQYARMGANALYLVVGTGLLYILCAFNMEIVAWILLLLPVLFFLSLIALLIFDLSLIDVTHTFQKRCYPHSVNGVPPPSCDSDHSA